ncbi:hypothetical protein BT96DRAFT_1004283 [Gymnopus androsaceus JB14]|uniref:Uncharacterized protein n=1 Tax=Gymnopus androsaceus JB14 TaxID=1447944 RepID=A0A6A4GT79_9AGAR|nr:hypothetical protein BT96DRAFT_1004283 [Gymnopus androsaceus JB14]
MVRQTTRSTTPNPLPVHTALPKDGRRNGSRHNIPSLTRSPWNPRNESSAKSDKTPVGDGEIVIELKSLVAVDEDEIENGSESESLVVVSELAAVAAVGELESLVAVDDDEIGNSSEIDGNEIGSEIESLVEELAVSVVLVGDKTVVELLAEVGEDVSVVLLDDKTVVESLAEVSEDVSVVLVGYKTVVESLAEVGEEVSVVLVADKTVVESLAEVGEEVSVVLVGERSVVALFEVADVSVGVEDGIVMDGIEMDGTEMVGRVMDGREKLKPVALVDVGLDVSEAVVDVELDMSEAVVDVAGKTDVVSLFKVV